MDKLQPLIKNRFWILAGLVLPLAMYGFFSANSKLKAATSTREGELDSALNNVPSGTNDANEKYAAGLKKINEVYSETVEDSIIGIWNTQQELMDWPPVVETYLPPLFLGEFDYRGIVAYQEAYERLMLDLQSRVEPVMPLEQSKAGPGVGVGGIRPSGPEQLADVPWKQKVILAASIPQANFGRMRATSEEIWNAQIDIWLLRLLFDAVARLNEDKDSATEAILRRIDVLQLVGGDGEPVVTGGDSAGGGGSGGYGEEMYDGGETSGGSGYGGGNTKPAGATKVPIEFSPAQEFGSAAGESSSGGDDEGSGSYGGMTGGAGQKANQLRYIADEEGKPYLERGFYMSVIIMQDKIPDFLVELANSEWPVRVTRFHVGKNPYYTGAVSSGSPYGGSFGEDDYAPDDMEAFSGRGGSSYGTETPFGGVGPNLQGIEGVGSLTKNLPKMADDAMQHPNLVQMDLCGVITIYKQPQSIIDAIENGGSLDDPAAESNAGVDSAAADGSSLPTDPATIEPVDPSGEATSVDPATEPAATPESPAPGSPAPASEDVAPATESSNTLELENL